MMYYGYGVEHMAGWGIFGLIVSVMFWLAIIFLIIAVLRRIFWGPRWRGHWMRRHDMMGGCYSALDILQERYAKGEINKEEYEQKKKDLME